MLYRAVGNRCAVDLSELKRIHTAALPTLQDLGFKVVMGGEASVVRQARMCIGKSKYKRTVLFTEAPDVVDCSSLTKWAYGKKGVWLPRRAEQQWGQGSYITRQQSLPGDLVFTGGIEGHSNIGHVGIMADQGTVIHAAAGVGVVEVSFDDFVGGRDIRGIRTFVNKDILTLECPPAYAIERSDDLYYIIKDRF